MDQGDVIRAAVSHVCLEPRPCRKLPLLAHALCVSKRTAIPPSEFLLALKQATRLRRQLGAGEKLGGE